MQRRRQQNQIDAVWLHTERVVIGSVLLDPRVLVNHASSLTAQDFLDPDHGLLWTLSLKWWAELSDALRQEVVEQTKGAPELFVDLYGLLIGHDTAERAHGLMPELVAKYGRSWAEKVDDAVHKLGLIAAQERYRSKVEGLQARLKTETQPETRAAIVNEIAAVPLPAGDAKTKKSGQWASEVIDAVLDGKAASEWVCPTGLAAFDSRNGGGLHPGRLYVVAGRPGWGKSAVAIQLAVNACRAGFGVGFLSLEMAEPDLILRMAAYITGVYMMDRDQTRYPLSDRERGLIEQARDEMQGWPLHMRCQPTNPDHLDAWASDLHQRAGVQVIIIDYLQILQGQPRQTDFERIKTASIRAKQLSQRGLAVVACAQLNREAEGTARPRASNLSGADQIAMDADAVVVPWRPREESAYPPGYAELLTIKGRRCKLGRDRIEWVGKTQSYHDSQDLWLEPVDESAAASGKGH